jgi:nitrogen fixation NifU-like protein
VLKGGVCLSFGRIRVGYSEKVMEFFRNPKNVGKIDNASVVATVGSIACGDMIRLYLKIKDDVVEKATFESYGCAANIATSVAVTELARDKTIDEAENISYRDVENFLDGLPKIKSHCAVLSVKALKIGLTKYKIKKGMLNFDLNIAKKLLSGVIDLVSGKSILKTDKLKDVRVEDKTLKIVFSEYSDATRDLEEQIREVFDGLDVKVDIVYEGS